VVGGRDLDCVVGSTLSIECVIDPKGPALDPMPPPGPTPPLPDARLEMEKEA